VLIDGIEPHDALIARLDDIGRRYKESGTLPDFERADFWHLLGWATLPHDAERTRESVDGNAEQD
jgi:hypothetical protein